jgi:hypothetical protein
MTTIKLRRGTTDEWATANPVLAQGEPGYDLEAAVLKIGDGTSAWSDLPGYLTGAALSASYVRADAAQAWTETQKQQALDNIGGGRVWTPRQWGATGTSDDTATFQRAVDALSADGGGTLWCDEPQYSIGNLIMKSGVVLRSLTQKATMVAPSGYSGWIIDTPATPKQATMGIQDLLIVGGVIDGSSPDTGGIRFQLTFQCQVSNVGIKQTSLGCFKQVAGQATQLIGCAFLNLYQYRTLIQDEGALWLMGTDHLVIGCECNGADYSAVQYPSDLFRAGMLVAGGTTWVYGSNGEYSDVGIKITGSSNRLIGARGDVNAGPGIVVEGTDNSLTNTLVLANSLGADGTYSHIQLGGGAYGTVLDGVTEGVNFTSVLNQPRYVVDDQVDIFGNPAIADSLPYIRDVVHQRQFKYRKINQKNLSRSIQPASAGNPISRPPSQHCAGETFYDTINGQLTVSDGSSWRNVSGAIVGNLIPPRTALLDDPAALGWVASGGTSAVAGVSGWAKFTRPRALEITADGTASSCGAQTAALIANIVASTLSVQSTYSLVAYHLGVTKLASLSFSLVWYNAAGSPVGAAVTTPSSVQTAVNTPQKYTASGLVAPANAVKASLSAIFTRAGMTGGEKYRITKFCLLPGANPGDFVEP